jgi:hypothetical protein
VVTLTLSVARWARNSALATFPEGRIGPGNFTPSLSQIINEPLDSSGSCQPEKAAAFHQDKDSGCTSEGPKQRSPIAFNKVHFAQHRATPLPNCG